ncbi:MAG: STAS domain-containing protein [Ruminococcaceae bacterium]|nr:STAS domain-containing protein [Oscillospiraceae bacterium]
MDMTTLVKDDKMIVYISGEIDHHTSREIRENVDRMIVMQRPKTLILDLEGVDFMDSSGLGLVLGRYKKIKELDGNMYICGADDRTMKILKMAGVDKIIKSVDNRTKNPN